MGGDQIDIPTGCRAGVLRLATLIGASQDVGSAHVFIDISVRWRMKIALLESSRQQPSDLADATSRPKGRLVTARQKAALDSAFVGRLRLYPRGYATSKWGPFHPRQVIFSLVRAGLLKVSPTMRLATLTKRAREIYSDPTMN